MLLLTSTSLTWPDTVGGQVGATWRRLAEVGGWCKPPAPLGVGAAEGLPPAASLSPLAVTGRPELIGHGPEGALRRLVGGVRRLLHAVTSR